jgi:hypothetical protein
MVAALTMMFENIGASWRAVVVGFTVALSALASGCGSDSGKRTVRDCSAECPEGYCDEDTGICTFAPEGPEGGAGGAGAAGGAAGVGGEASEPSMPEGGAGGRPSVDRDELAPSLAITRPGEGEVLGPDVSFEFEADEPATYRCFLNDEELDECEPGLTLVDLLSGEHTFSVIAIDEAGNESELVEVTFVVNRAPTIDDVADIVTPEDISTGALPFGIEDEDNAAEDLIVTATLDGELPIPAAGVSLGGSGGLRTITLNPALNAFGSAVLTIEVSDGFVSTTKQVPVVVTPVNDPPQIEDVADKRVAEDSVLGPETFHVSDVETPADQLVVTALSGNTTRIPQNNIVLGGSGEERTFTITPAAQQSGTATVTLTVSDGEATASDPFVVTLASSDDAPTISTIANQTTAEDTAKTVSFTVGDPDTALASLTPSASFDATGVVQSVSFSGSGANRSLTVTPKPNQSGSALISVSISDASGGVSTSFTLTVTPVNDAPTVNGPANQTIDEDGSTGSLSFTVADIDSGSLTVTAASNNTTLVPNAKIVVAPVTGAPGTRSVTVTPAANRNGGPVTITLTASDGSLTGTDTFTVTVNASNDGPTITGPADQTVGEDESTGALSFSVGDSDSATLTVTASSSNTTLIPNANVVVAPVSGAPGARTVTVTPAANAHGGPVTITLQVSDGALSASDTFTVTVTPVNDPPSISNITDKTVEPAASTGSIAFTVGDPDGDTLMVSASSSVTRVAPTANLTLGGSGNSRTISIQPGTNQGGTSTITVEVSDGNGGTASDTFVLSVKVALEGLVSGNGTVTATGTGCPGGNARCAALPGTGTVTFVATPDVGAVFNGWSGACTGTGNGVVSPIPTAGVTCTAEFSNLWARLFYTPDDPAKQEETNAVAVVETSSAIRYLGNRVAGNTSTSVVWNAEPLTGQVVAGSAYELLTAQGTNLPGIDLAVDPADADGTVALVNVTSSRSGLVWLDRANKPVESVVYLSASRTDSNVPTGLLRDVSGGLTFIESSHNTSPVAVFPTYAHLVRLDATGAPLGATRYLEAVGADCNRPSVNNYLAPRALAQDDDGNYLVASMTFQSDPIRYRLNLTLFDKEGVPQWGRRIVPSNLDFHLFPFGVTANGSSFVVTGAQSDVDGGWDAFALSITNAGAISWAKAFGSDGLNDVAARGVLGGAGVVITGYAATDSGLDLFAGVLSANGSSLRGYVYGGGADEIGLAIARSATGFNLFGGSTSSFGQLRPASWALRVDDQLGIALETGTVEPYAPVLVNQAYTVTETCLLPDSVYSTFMPAREAQLVSTAEVSVGGPFQANP